MAPQWDPEPPRDTGPQLPGVHAPGDTRAGSPVSGAGRPGVRPPVPHADHRQWCRWDGEWEVVGQRHGDSLRRSVRPSRLDVPQVKKKILICFSSSPAFWVCSQEAVPRWEQEIFSEQGPLDHACDLALLVRSQKPQEGPEGGRAHGWPGCGSSSPLSSPAGGREASSSLSPWWDCPAPPSPLQA